jgi:hypothetical protein
LVRSHSQNQKTDLNRHRPVPGKKRQRGAWVKPLEIQTRAASQAFISMGWNSRSLLQPFIRQDNPALVPGLVTAHPLRIFRKGLHAKRCAAIESAEEKASELDRGNNLLSELTDPTITIVKP